MTIAPKWSESRVDQIIRARGSIRQEDAIGILDPMLAQLGELDARSISLAVGMSEVRVEAAIAALSVAQVQPGDTITLAAASSALPVERLQEVMRLLGGEAGLARMADLMGDHKGKGSIWDSLEDLAGNLGC